MHPMLNIAVRAVRKAGDLIAKYYEIFNIVEANLKCNNEFITNINRNLEHLIIKVIRKYYPQHAIIRKNISILVNKNTDVQWIIDPLNGINNFIKRFPHVAISIAVRIKGYIEIAVVYDPIRNELFTASRGYGAQLNGHRLRGGNTYDLNNIILATSFSFKQKQHTNSYIDMVSKLFIHCADFRCTGSTALDFAYVAAGRVDGFFEIGLKSCDFTIGELLVREAGGLVTDFTGDHNYFISGNIIAGNPRVVKAIISIMHGKLP